MKVSVLMITYNHARFIAQAIDSVLIQEVNFDYELVIGEDCSTDGTRDIVIDFHKRYPDRIKLLLSEKNLGMHNNLVQTLQACEGQYIALLEGDDLWASPHKLQKQVNFLDTHSECSICFHNAKMMHEDSNQESENYNSADQKEISTIKDLWIRNFIATCSVMFRKGLFGAFPDWYYATQYGDWPLHILNAQHGKVGYINEIMGIYRVHSGGVWSGLSEIQKLKDTIKFYEIMNANLKFRYQKDIKVGISKHYYVLAEEYEKTGDLDHARAYAVKCFVECPFKQIQSREFLEMLLRLYTPRFYSLVITSNRYIRTTARKLLR